ncbi:GTP pyrophosphokinase [Bacillus mexicanus]|uniref:GTP pyrophosphokinase n=1 Tax=Bacillus mexicanus TaxID=2834415 RepID=UPI003D20F5DB
MQQDLNLLLEKSIELAFEFHKGQVDKGGNPYTDHLLRVMNGLTTVPEKIVGVLHDIVEDTEMTFAELKERGYPFLIIEAIDSITRREDETRDQFIFRVSQNPIGRKVKLEDLRDNMDLSRIKKITEKDVKRIKMYQRDVLILTQEGWRFNGKKFKKTK